MNLDSVSTIMSQAVNLILIASLPSVGIGLLVGLAIAIVQAVTQIQEQTLTFVPKMVAVFLVLALTFPWMSVMLMDLTTSLWNNIPIYSK